MRLIDAVSLIEFIVSHNTNDAVAKALIRIVVDQMTVDATPVIRCSECMYYDGRDCDHSQGMVEPEADSFCSKGERRDDK